MHTSLSKEKSSEWLHRVFRDASHHVSVGTTVFMNAARLSRPRKRVRQTTITASSNHTLPLFKMSE